MFTYAYATENSNSQAVANLIGHPPHEVQRQRYKDGIDDFNGIPQAIKHHEEDSDDNNSIETGGERRSSQMKTANMTI